MPIMSNKDEGELESTRTLPVWVCPGGGYVQGRWVMSRGRYVQGSGYVQGWVLNPTRHGTWRGWVLTPLVVATEAGGPHPTGINSCNYFALVSSI